MGIPFLVLANFEHTFIIRRRWFAYYNIIIDV